VGSESERYSSAVEDYLKVIYAFEEREEGKITTTRLAERLGVSASSVSGMVRKLCQLDLLEHPKYGNIEFTDTGRRVALGVVRRHAPFVAPEKMNGTQRLGTILGEIRESRKKPPSDTPARYCAAHPTQICGSALRLNPCSATSPSKQPR